MALIVAFAAVWYLQGYIGYFGDQAKYRLQNSVVNSYIAGQEAQQKQLENTYKNDPYGGATPQETLKLFIEALEKKDYVLASNYFIPEKRAGYLKDLPVAERSGGVIMLVNAYKTGTVESEKYSNEDKFRFKVLAPNDDAPFIFTIVKNLFNGKWLILDY